MSELTDLLKFLHGAGASIIPWILIAMAIWFVVYMRPHLVEYIKVNSEAKMTRAQKEGERNEIIRNCSATIEACTTVLEMSKRDRELVMDHVDKHEAMSAERMEHIQTVVNQCRDEIIKARGDIKGIRAQLDK